MRSWCTSTYSLLTELLYSASMEIIVASLPFKHEQMSLLQWVRRLSRLEVLEDFGCHFKVWDWIFSIQICRPSEWSLKLAAGKYKIKGEVNLSSDWHACMQPGIDHMSKIPLMFPNPASRVRTQYFLIDDSSN